MDDFHALSEPTRRNILEAFAGEGQLSATQIADRFAVSPSAISQHLRILREAGLVTMEKRAQQRIYRINPDAMLEVQDWARRLTRMWERRFDALGAVLRAETAKAETAIDDTRRIEQEQQDGRVDAG